MKILKTTFRTIVIIILLLLPFVPITENFFAPETQIENQTFLKYILICLGITAVGFGLISFAKKSNSKSGWLLFAIGFVAMIPLHLGQPRMGSDLLTFSSIEQFRYGILIFATTLLFLVGLKIISPLKSVQSKIFLGILIITTLINLWDNYTSFMLGSKLKNWISDGKNADDFFAQFDFQIMWLTFARISLYITAIVLTYISFKNSEIKKWQFALLSIFCLVGIVFCIMCLQTGFQNYYFPFMIPAIALAPSFWIGITLLGNKSGQEKLVENG